MERYVLKTANEGMAAAKAFCISESDESGNIAKISFDSAVESLKKSLEDAASKAGKEYDGMIEAQILLLEDPHFTGEARRLMEAEGTDPIEAIKKAALGLAQEFEDNPNPYIRGRAADVKGLAGELVLIISGRQTEELKEDAILVAQEISPALFLKLDRQKIRGMVTKKGSSTSHLAVLAGSVGIPYLYGDFDQDSINDGDRLIIDGESLTVGPDDETWKEALKKAEKQALAKSGKTAGHTDTGIFANAGSAGDVERAANAGADGIGLMRTEFLFLDRASAPSEDEQFEVYSKAAKLMGEKELTIRTMDIGADKTPAWLDLPSEKNPSLGCRGIRVSLQNEQLFKTQLRALLRASANGNIRIMLPMITSVWELDDAAALMRGCMKELESEGLSCRMPKVGVMIETPAAVMMAPELAEKADFFSIGTNDLTQYTMALDRESEDPGRYEESGIEPVFRMISLIIKAARGSGIDVCVCGELAGREDMVKRLIDEGVDKLSVSVAKLERTREKAAEAEIGRKRPVSVTCGYAAPADGRIVPMEEIPDPAFSSGELGQCIGIMPENGRV